MKLSKLNRNLLVTFILLLIAFFIWHLFLAGGDYFAYTQLCRPVGVGEEQTFECVSFNLIQQGVIWLVGAFALITLLVLSYQSIKNAVGLIGKKMTRRKMFDIEERETRIDRLSLSLIFFIVGYTVLGIIFALVGMGAPEGVQASIMLLSLLLPAILASFFIFLVLLIVKMIFMIFKIRVAA